MVADRYRLDERIGSGPMGEVWRGYDTRADWVVAVKVLGARAAGAATREVLRQHAQAVARVIHPNVAMVLDVGEHEGAPFLVMEYLTGLSLGEELAARGPMKIVEVCDLVGQAAAGLDAAHRAGVVHGQVDPDSFRLASSGVLKVVGFGMDGREPVRGDGRYAAPERTTEEAAQPSGDVYALGSVCYALLCGRPPSGEQLVPPSATRSEVPPELDRLVLAMIDQDPAKRPTSGEAIRRTLAAIARPKPGPPVTGVGLRDSGLQMGAPGMGSPGMGAPVTGAASVGAGGPGAGGPGVGGPGVGGPGAGGPGPGPARPRGPEATEVFQVGAAGGPGRAARAGDTAIYQAGDLGQDQPAGPNRKLILQLGIAVLVIAAVTVGMVMWAGARKEEPVAVVTPTTEPTGLASLLGTPFPTPTSTEEETPEDLFTPDIDIDDEPTSLIETAAPKATLGRTIPPGGYGRWLKAFDDALMAQQGTGGINPQVAGKARDKLRKAARKAGEGHADSTLDHIAGVYRDLVKAQERGDMNGTGPAAQFIREWPILDR
ncbi:serine/threonine-protein kinase [Nonomuraea insulae]|uniref:Serine/threonine-protein kinase n=1 Tax=Nonomuraea insulae TaxID=1616787 RepID=A0ABW1D0P9_9ACTN